MPPFTATTLSATGGTDDVGSIQRGMSGAKDGPEQQIQRLRQPACRRGVASLAPSIVEVLD